MTTRRYLSQADKNEIGNKCANCMETNNLEYHHIIPIIVGGKDINSNMVCLCSECHKKLHGIYKHEYINHSLLIKKGIKKAKENGVQIGRPKTTLYDIPDIFYQYYQVYKKGTINISQLFKLTKLSRTTVYKYLNLIGQ